MSAEWQLRIKNEKWDNAKCADYNQENNEPFLTMETHLIFASMHALRARLEEYRRTQDQVLQAIT